MASALRDYEYAIERCKYELQNDGEFGYQWEEVARCKTFERAASLLGNMSSKFYFYRTRYLPTCADWQ